MLRFEGMETEPSTDRIACPSCGGAGGGPFGRAGSAWDDEDYVCPRCKGVGAIRVGEVARPGLVKASPDPAPAPAVETDAEKKRKASA